MKAVQLQLRKGTGAKFIKICASGGIASELDEPSQQQFSYEEIKAFVEEAARADRIVAAHCHSKRGIMAALRAGVHTIEHGTELDDESIALMIKQKCHFGSNPSYRGSNTSNGPCSDTHGLSEATCDRTGPSESICKGH
jgi:imidazolonepropionase-like amidohydrolase